MSDAYKINDNNQIVGGSTNASGQTRAFIFHEGAMAEIPLLAGHTSAYANSINNHGVVVGNSSQSGNSRAFLYDGATSYDLNYVAASLLSDGSTPGFTALLMAQDINDSGTVVGTGMYFDGASSYWQAYSLTISSVPEPSAYAALLGGLAAASVVFRRLMVTRLSRSRPNLSRFRP